jgi:hypothetical protein
MATKETSKTNSKTVTKITTPPFRVSFPNVFKPKSNFEGQEPAYSVQMLFPKNADLTAMKKAVEEAKRKKWGSDKTAWPKFKHPVFKDGNEKNMEAYKDMIVVEARTKQKPGLVDRSCQEIIDPGEFYPGCWARATLTCFAYEKAGNKGVSFGLQNLQKVKDDTAFSGKKNAKDDFEALDELEDDGDEGEGFNNDDEDLDSEDF